RRRKRYHPSNTRARASRRRARPRNEGRARLADGREKEGGRRRTLPRRLAPPDRPGPFWPGSSPTSPPVIPGGYLATFTSKVTLFVPPELVISSLYFPAFAGVNLTSHFGPGLVSLPTSFWFAS